MENRHGITKGSHYAALFLCLPSCKSVPMALILSVEATTPDSKRNLEKMDNPRHKSIMTFTVEFASSDGTRVTIEVAGENISQELRDFLDASGECCMSSDRKLSDGDMQQFPLNLTGFFVTALTAEIGK